MSKEKSNKRPGVMIYFDDIRALRKLGEKELGKFIIAIQEYAEVAVLPDFSDNVALEMMWEITKSKLDRDKEKYDFVITQRQYAAYARWQKKLGNEPISFEAWIESEQ